MKHAVKHLRFPKAAVEAIAKFRQITGQMLGADAMVDAPDIAFHIGDQGFNDMVSKSDQRPEAGTCPKYFG